MCLRKQYRGIMAGIGTVLADDPMLTCRIEGAKDPVRIICDTHLRIPEDSKIVQTADRTETILATSCSDKDRYRPYLEKGCQILAVPEKDGHIDLKILMKALGEKGIDSVLLEGGGTLNWSALKEGIVQKVFCYIAPKLLGGKGAKSPVEGLGFPDPRYGVQLINRKYTIIGEDMMIEGEVKADVYRNH